MKGWRTRILAFVVGSIGIVEQFYPDTIKQLIPQEYNGLAMMVIAIVILGLRQITTTPPGQS